MELRAAQGAEDGTGISLLRGDDRLFRAKAGMEFWCGEEQEGIAKASGVHAAAPDASARPVGVSPHHAYVYSLALSYPGLSVRDVERRTCAV